MSRYADPLACPDCHSALPVSSVTCPVCDLPLRHPLATELLRTLTYADQLLERLRATTTAAPLPVYPTPAPPPLPQPVTQHPAARRTGVRASSVPKILLSLGAICLLVAAVIFLAVAWSWLGVGGRTAVLVTLTAASGGLGAWLGIRGLRVAGESLTAVALGLLVLDVVGADNAGWLGDLSQAGLVFLVGIVAAAVSLALALAPPRLAVPQVAAAAGLCLSVFAAVQLTTHDLLVLATGVLAFTALAAVGRLTTLTHLPWFAFGGATVTWIALTTRVVDDLQVAGSLTMETVWADGPGWALLAATAMLLLPVAFDRRRETVVSCGAAAASLLSITLTLPAYDESLTVATLVALGIVGVWAAASFAAPAAWAVVAKAPATLAAVLVAFVAFMLTFTAAARVLFAESTTRSEHLASPALLLPSVAALLLVCALWLPLAESRRLWPVAAGALAAAAVATLALYPVPLWTLVTAIGALGAALVADSLRRTFSLGTTEAVLGVGVLGAALVAGRESDLLLTLVLAAVTTTAAAFTFRGRFPAATPLGDLLLPAAGAALLWSTFELAGQATVQRAVPVLLVVGLLALARPRVEIEASAMTAGAVAAAVSVLSAVDTATALSIHLTLAGALVVATAVVHESRRPLAWLGGFLLALATWVRLADLGVEAPEAYTLPTAVALVLVGLDRMRRDPTASTSATVAPGLVLATVPSLLWVVATDPVSLRAALLGLGCLALVLAGALLRWSAPLLTGALVGGVLVLRELAPYAGQTPQWVVIGLAGTLLTVVGVTWEQRLVELRHASAYLGRLR
ncbi:MAG: hypothetical protein Q7J48_21390 [Nocardioides sp.]|nr:hypothetical protein [Nocardioides sp.]